MEEMNHIKYDIDEQNQYSRRNILRFHKVPVPPGTHHTINTDNIVLDLVNNKMNLTPPLTLDEIDRSHTMGPVDQGTVQTICKFTTWNTKFRVISQKKNLAKHKTSQFRVFITEDLTKPKKEIIYHLNNARLNKKIFSFWTVDGKIFYKERESDLKVHVKDLEKINYLVPDPIKKMVQNPWKA